MKSTDKLLKLKPVKREQIKYKNKSYWLNYMSATQMQEAQFSGYAHKGEVYISGALSGRSKRFVIQHELYHLRDKQNWLGYFGQELRANVVCGLKDPLGLCTVIELAIKNRRLRMYGLRLLTNLRRG